MKKLTLFTSLTLVLLVCSCKKNDDQTLPDPSSALMKSMVFNDTTGYFFASMSIQYDSKGKIFQMVIYNPPYSDSLIHKYEYYPNMVIDNISYTNNNKFGKNIYYLNSDGLAVSETDMGYSQNGDSSVAQTVTYKYIDGYMTEKKAYLYGDTSTVSTMKWHIKNGNITSMAFGISAWGGGMVTETYEYYPNSVNTLGYSNTGMMFFGKSSTNLLKSSVTNNNTPDTVTYSYSFDSMSRVITEFIRGDGITNSTSNVTCSYY